MLELVDSHCHLHNAEYFPGYPADYLERAAAAGVRQIVVIGTSYQDSIAAAEFATAHDNAYWTFGVHPSEFEKSYTEPDFPTAPSTPASAAPGATTANPSTSSPATPFSTRPLAIGEVGLDYHYGPEDFGGLDLSPAEMRQREWRLLEQMLDLGVRHHLPFAFHVREAFDDFFDILHNFTTTASLAGAPIRGVVHSFSDNKKNLRRVLEAGFYVGVNGLATYSTLPRPPLDRILLETDAPFLAPVPHRHERCEPAYVRHVAEWLADSCGVPLEEVATVTTANFRQLFQLA